MAKVHTIWAHAPSGFSTITELEKKNDQQLWHPHHVSGFYEVLVAVVVGSGGRRRSSSKSVG